MTLVKEQEIPEFRDYPYLHLDITPHPQKPDHLIQTLRAVNKSEENSFHIALSLKKTDSIEHQLRMLITSANALLQRC